MADMAFNDENFQAMKAAQQQITRAVMPFRERIEAALIIFALIRVARVLLRLYPKKFQLELLPVLTSYLRGDVKQPNEDLDPASLLWHPGKES